MFVVAAKHFLRFVVIFGIIIFFIQGDNINAGVLFNYPRDGKFKMLPPVNDRWYYVDYKNWAIKCPDKWQHYIGNYVAASLLKKHQGTLKTVTLLTAANTIKEIEDGFREGASLRDFAIGTLGLLAGTFKPNLFCEYDSEKILLVYYIKF